MSSEPYPVILVHGWNSHPGIWNRLVPRLSDASIPFWKFDHTGMNGADLSELAAALGASVGEMRDECGYAGSIDMVCHSIGTCIARLPPPDQYCHINLPKNPVVIERIRQYLTRPVP